MAGPIRAGMAVFVALATLSGCAGGAPADSSSGIDGRSGSTLGATPSPTGDPTPAGFLGEIRHPSTGPCAVTQDPATGRTWVSYANTRQINEVDPITGATITTLSLAGTRPCGMAFVDGALWVGIVRDSVVQRMDPSTGEITGEVALTGNAGPMVVAFDHLWVLDLSGPAVRKIDPATATEVGSIRVEGSPRVMVATDEGIWLVRESPGVVSLIDPETVTIVEEASVVPGIRNIAVGDGALWVTRARLGTMHRIDLEDRSVGEPISVGDDPRGISYGFGFLWVGDVTGQLAQVDPGSGQVVGRYPFAVGTVGAAPIGEQLWVFEPDRIVQIDPGALG